MQIWDEQPVDEDSFLLDKMTIEGAQWTGESLEASNQLTSNLKMLKCTWVKSESVQNDESSILVPVYLNQTRQNLLFSVKLNRGSLERNFLYKRGVALITWREE